MFFLKNALRSWDDSLFNGNEFQSDFVVALTTISSVFYISLFHRLYLLYLHSDTVKCRIKNNIIN